MFCSFQDNEWRRASFILRPYLGSNCEHDGEIILINNLIDVGTQLSHTRLCVVHPRQEIYSICEEIQNMDLTKRTYKMFCVVLSSFLFLSLSAGDKKKIDIFPGKQ